MEDIRNKLDIPPEGIDTPDGYLYYPPSQGRQTLFLIASFFSAIVLGLIISSIPGDLSDLATGAIYFVYILTFILGYTLWAGSVGAMMFGSIKLPLLKVIYRFFIHREKPRSINDFLPSREQIIKMMLRVQKSAKIFFILSFPIGIGGGFLTMFFKTTMSSTQVFLLVMLSDVLYGYALFYFGRRGYFPFPEG